MRILADASLPGLENAFPPPFTLSLYSDNKELMSLLKGQDILLCRATLKVNSELLKEHHLKYVATASSGTDHLDHSFLNSQKIQIIDAKGANASAVADYVVSCLAYLEKNKLINGNKAGVIGIGKVGEKVCTRLHHANYQLALFDPLKALQDQHFQSCAKEELYDMDLLCIHAELHDQPPYPSANLLDDVFLAALKPGCVIINAARGGIINEEALLNTSQPLIYCTDVYANEPAIDERMVNRATLCTPHIAGHTIEAKLAAVTMVSEKLHHLSGLPVPQFNSTLMPPHQIMEISKDKSWQEVVLSLYNPADETAQLKQSLDKKNAFLNLRKSHQKRHDFSIYSELISNQNIKLFFVRDKNLK